MACAKQKNSTDFEIRVREANDTQSDLLIDILRRLVKNLA